MSGLTPSPPVAWASEPVRYLLSEPRTGSEAHATKHLTRPPLK